MLPTNHRLRRSGEIRRVQRSGKGVRSTFLAVRALSIARRSVPRFAFIVGTKVSKKAVVRNRWKRRLRAAVKARIAHFPVADYTITVRPGVLEPTYRALEQDVALLSGRIR